MVAQPSLASKIVLPNHTLGLNACQITVSAAAEVVSALPRPRIAMARGSNVAWKLHMSVAVDIDQHPRKAVRSRARPSSDTG